MCRREAPEVEQFARDNADVVDVVGLGTQDDVRLAERFVDDNGPFSFPMFWDESFVSWDELGVAGQPAFALFGADGAVIDAWYGGMDAGRVLGLLPG